MFAIGGSKTSKSLGSMKLPGILPQPHQPHLVFSMCVQTLRAASHERGAGNLAFCNQTQSQEIVCKLLTHAELCLRNSMPIRVRQPPPNPRGLPPRFRAPFKFWRGRSPLIFDSYPSSPGGQLHRSSSGCGASSSCYGWPQVPLELWLFQQ